MQTGGHAARLLFEPSINYDVWDATSCSVK